MGEIEWAMWANEQAVVSALLLLVGGIIGVAAQFRYWQCAAGCIGVGIIVLLFEWPRSKRTKGNTIERMFQNFLATVIDKLGPIGKNYYFRFVAQLLLSIPSFLLLPTIIGGICLVISAFIYLTAAIKGEQWRSTAVHTTISTNTAGRAEPPSHPPPRYPNHSDSKAALDVNIYSN